MLFKGIIALTGFKHLPCPGSDFSFVCINYIFLDFIPTVSNFVLTFLPFILPPAPISLQPIKSWERTPALSTDFFLFLRSPGWSLVSHYILPKRLQLCPPQLQPVSVHTHQVSSCLDRLSFIHQVFCLEEGPVQLFKLDGGETRGAEGPAFVLRHRTLNLTEHTTESTPTDPMSMQGKGDTPNSGPSTSHLSTSGCSSHNGVSVQHTLTGCVAQYGSTGRTVKPSHQDTQPRINNLIGVVSGKV